MVQQLIQTNLKKFFDKSYKNFKRIIYNIYKKACYKYSKSNNKLKEKYKIELKNKLKTIMIAKIVS